MKTFTFVCFTISMLWLNSVVWAEHSVETVLEEPEVEKHYEKKLVIVSSFPAIIGSTFKQAFEKKHPKVEVIVTKKKTTAGIKLIESKKNNNNIDLFWVSAPDAFEVLKEKGLLQKYTPKTKGIPKKVNGYPVNDPEGYYVGFSSSGYGIMWNTEYLKKHNLPEPKQWVDLTRSEYRRHIGLSAPSRSGTTHLTIEGILQLKGWKQGWSIIKEIGANAKVITQKSSHVPKGVINGDFGIGIVIDLYALSAIAADHPIGFSYPTDTVFVPANIGIIKNAPEKELAADFIEFVLSEEGQKLLLEPGISRLPIRPEIYSGRIPNYYPLPYGDKQYGSVTPFDVKLSKGRYNVVNSLFDVMITYQHEDLQLAMRAIQNAEISFSATRFAKPKIAKAINLSRDLINKLPVDEATSSTPNFASKFTQRRKKESDVIEGEQAEIEKKWQTMAQDNYDAVYDAVSIF
ncbi:MAG: extracellular solute-binding protein [Cocleimonas sp.]